MFLRNNSIVPKKPAPARRKRTIEENSPIFPKFQDMKKQFDVSSVLSRLWSFILKFLFMVLFSCSLMLLGAYMQDKSTEHMLCESANLTGGTSTVYDLSKCSPINSSQLSAYGN
jgi:hypothetical protein